MGFFNRLRPKNGRSAKTKIPKEANIPPKLDPTQIKSIPLCQEPSQGELLNRVELGDFKALTDYSDKRGGFSDEVLCAIAKREDLRALGGYDLFKKLLKDRFELCPPKNIDEESMSLGKHLFALSIARKYKTPLYTLINGGVLPSENEITDLIKSNEYVVNVYLEKSGDQLTPEQFELAKIACYSDTYLANNMRNGYTYSQADLDDFIIQEDINLSRDSAFMIALGEMQAKDFSVKSLNICLESSSLYLMEIAANIFATGVICTEKMKIKLLASPNWKRYHPLIEALRRESTAEVPKPKFSIEEIEELFEDQIQKFVSGYIAHSSILLAQIAINQPEVRALIVKRLVDQRKNRSNRNISYKALVELAEKMQACLEPYKSDLLTPTEDNKGNLDILAKAIENGLAINDTDKTQLYKMAYTQRAFLIIASAVQNGGLTFDEAEVNGFFEKLSYGEEAILMALIEADHPFTEPQHVLIAGNKWLNSALVARQNVPPSSPFTVTL